MRYARRPEKAPAIEADAKTMEILSCALARGYLFLFVSFDLSFKCSLAPYVP